MYRRSPAREEMPSESSHLAASSATNRSEPGLDLYRALVVLMMFVVHAHRLQSGPGSGQLERSLAFFMWAEPYIAASFLFIAGVALVLAHQKLGAGLLRKVAGRAVGLYVLASVLFVPQFGVEFPDLLVSPGILSAIAIAVFVCAAALVSRAPRASLAAITCVVLGTTAWLDWSGATVPGLNAGPGGAIPLIAFTGMGALFALSRARNGSRTPGIAFAISVVLFVVVIASGARWTTERSSFYGVHDGLLALDSLGAAGPKRAVSFWNHSALGALGLCLPLGASLLGLLRIGRGLAQTRPLYPLLALGRHALLAYVAHLGVLGVIDLSGAAPATSTGTWGLVALLSAGALAGSVALDGFQRARRARARQA